MAFRQRLIGLFRSLSPLQRGGNGEGREADGSAHARELKYTVCDVFAEEPLAGNQLAVFPDAGKLAEREMRRLAREINFSETVFVFPPREGGDRRIRIFTPVTEMPFAGHPVLGSAVVVGRLLGLDTVRLETGRGVVPIALKLHGDRHGSGRVSQPLPTIGPFADSAALLAALGVERSVLPIELYDNGARHVYVALATIKEVAALKPDLAAVAAVTDAGVNCFAGGEQHWKTRMFHPTFGVAEDPATGSAAGPLAVHLAQHGLIEFGEEIEISQGAEIGRPSTLFALADGSHDAISKVEVAGQVWVVAEGRFFL